jgi:hypothetical protein
MTALNRPSAEVASVARTDQRDDQRLSRAWPGCREIGRPQPTRQRSVLVCVAAERRRRSPGSPERGSLVENAFTSRCPVSAPRYDLKFICLLPRAVVRNRLAQFIRSQIRSASRKAVVDIRQNNAAVYRGGPGFQLKVER